MVPLAHATDSGGSIRIPAASCGVVGFMPSAGIMPYASMVDPFRFARHFFITKTVRDARLLLHTLLNPQELAAENTAVSAIGCVEVSPDGHDFHPEVTAALATISERLRGEQLSVTACRLAFHGEEFYRDIGALHAVELALVIETYAQRLGRPPHRDELDPYTVSMLKRGRTMSGVETLRTLRRIQNTVKRVNEGLQAYDIVMTPVYAERVPLLTFLSPTTPELLDTRAQTLFPYTRIFNAAGHPAISIPAGWDVRGLPIGIQLVGRYGHDWQLLRVAERIADPFVRAPRHHAPS
jgi:amidase